MQDWRGEWTQIAMRLNAWTSIAKAFCANYGFFGFAANQAQASNVLVAEAQQLMFRIRGLSLPQPFQAAVIDLRDRLEQLARVVEGPSGVMHQIVVLGALRAPIDEAFASSEEPRRALVDRAFLHLNRTLIVDDAARQRWREAFKLETRCEKLGAVHLLAHGIYAFKADAISGRTDLILGEPLRIADDVQSATVLVLTEWKLVRSAAESTAKALEARRQAERYSKVELGGFELRQSRYLVLVSMQPVAVPPTEIDGSTTYRYVNIVIEAPRPSDWAAAAQP